MIPRKRKTKIPKRITSNLSPPKTSPIKTSFENRLLSNNDSIRNGLAMEIPNQIKCTIALQALTPSLYYKKRKLFSVFPITATTVENHSDARSGRAVR
jgi:hypothetical protein